MKVDLTEFELQEVYVGHTYIFKTEVSSFGFKVLVANEHKGILVSASKPRLVRDEGTGKLKNSRVYWLPMRGRVELRKDGVAFVFGKF